MLLDQRIPLTTLTEGVESPGKNNSDKKQKINKMREIQNQNSDNTTDDSDSLSCSKLTKIKKPGYNVGGWI